MGQYAQLREELECKENVQKGKIKKLGHKDGRVLHGSPLGKPSGFGTKADRNRTKNTKGFLTGRSIRTLGKTKNQGGNGSGVWVDFGGKAEAYRKHLGERERGGIRSWGQRERGPTNK